MFEWVTSANEHLPEGAVCAGYQNNGDPLFVGRAHFKHTLIPGKILRSDDCLYFSYAGVEQSTSQYEVLVDKTMSRFNDFFLLSFFHSVYEHYVIPFELVFPEPFSWINLFSRQSIPDGAVVGGYDIDETPLYVARANHQGDTIPGKHVPNHHIVYVPYGGKEHAKEEYEILCNGNVAWVESAYGFIPSNAVVGGKTRDGEMLYIGRASFGGSLTPGKIHPSLNTLYIPFDGREYAFSEYEVLVVEEE